MWVYVYAQTHARATNTGACIFVMFVLTWGASTDACLSRVQDPLPAPERDQRTAVGRVRPAHIAWVSARPASAPQRFLSPRASLRFPKAAARPFLDPSRQGS